MADAESAKRVYSFLVDSSCLRHVELEEYLREDYTNIAVISEVTAFEPYKNRSVTAIGRNLEICCRYPTQLRVLRGISDIIAMEETGAVSDDEYIDPIQTNGSSDFCRGLQRAIAGDAPYLTAVLRHVAAAEEHIARVKQGLGDVSDGLRAFARSLSPESLAAMRRGELYPGEVLQRSWSFTLELTNSFFERSYPKQTIHVDSRDAFDRILFRYAAAGTVLALWWARKGGIDTVRPDRLLNDLIDLQQVALATKFDGLMTRDAKMMEIYSETSALLTVVGERLGAA